MYDYREERFYKIFLVLFIVYHCQKNKAGKNILSLKKLEVIYYLLQHQSIMKELLERLNIGDLKEYKSTLYDLSSRISDYKEIDDIGGSISYLCTLNKIKLINLDGIAYFEINDFHENEFESEASDFLKSNIDKIKK